jgi:hypothetical protein
MKRMEKNRNTDIRQEINIFILRQKVKEHQQNYFEHILRMQPYQIPWKLSITLKEEDRHINNQSIGRIKNSANPDIRTG